MSRGRALVAAAAAAAAAAQQAGCSFDSGVGVSFDLSPLRSDTGYTMVDVNNKSDPSGDPTITAQWEFRFSICQDMDGKAGFPGGPGASVCATTQSDAVPGGPPPVSNSNPAPAFRYCTGNCGTLPASMRPCQRLGDTAANAQLLTHPWNLASGVTVQYTGGDNCTSKLDGSTTPRSLRIIMQCVDETRNGVVPKDDDIVPYASGCAWTSLVRSQIACPQECPVVVRSGVRGRRLCAHNGVCAYDLEHSVARCFCNEGWSGADCSIPGDKGLPAAKSYTGSIVGALAGGVVGGALLFVAAVFAKAKMSNSTFLGAFDFAGLLSCGCLSFGVSRVGQGGGYAAAPAEPTFSAPAFTGASDTAYVAPDVNAAPPTGGGTGTEAMLLA